MASPEKNNEGDVPNGVGNINKQTKIHKIFKTISLVLTSLILLSLLGILVVQIYLYFREEPNTEIGYVKVPIEIITPSKDKEPPQLSGRVLDSDGNPLDGYFLNIKPSDRTVNIISGGYFMFDNLGIGDYLISLADSSGKIITDVKMKLSLGDIAGISVMQNEDSSFNIILSRDIYLEELVIIFDKNTKKITFDTYRVTYLTKDGLVATPTGTAKTSDGVIITPSGNICLQDKSVLLPVVEPDGSRWIIMPDATLKKLAPGSYNGITVENDGAIILPDKTKILPNGKIINPAGEESTQGESGVIISNGIVTYIGYIPPTRDLPHLSGRLISEIGSTLPLNYRLVYKEFGEEALIGNSGYFTIANFQEGSHTLQLLDSEGKIVSELKISIVKSFIDGMSLSGNPADGYTLTVGNDVRLSELILTFNSITKVISVDIEKTTYIKTNGYVKTPAGSATKLQGVIITPAGDILLEDGKILLPIVGENGGRWAFVNNESLVFLNPGTYDGVVISTDGKINLSDGTSIDKDGKITVPGKDPTTQGETGVIIKDKTVTPIGYIPTEPTDPPMPQRALPHLSGRLLGKDGKPVAAKFIWEWEEAKTSALTYNDGYFMPDYISNGDNTLSIVDNSGNRLSKVLANLSALTINDGFFMPDNISNGKYTLLFDDNSGNSQPKVLEKTRISALTNNDGYFMLDNINNGEHTIIIVDNNGNELSSFKVTIRTTSVSGVVISGNATDGYIISIGTDIRLLDLVFIYDKDSGKVTIDTSRVTYITTGGYVTTPAGSATNKSGVIVTPSGNILLDDGTILLPIVEENGGRRAILENEELVLLEPGTYKNFVIGKDGTITLSDGTTIDKYGWITAPGKTPVMPGESGVIIKNGTVTAIGYTPPSPPGPPYPPTSADAKAEIIVLNGKKSGSGEIMDADTKPFVAEGMYPGDSITKYYCLEVTPNGTVSMRFFITLKDQNAKLGEVLNVKVTLWEKEAGGSYVKAGVVYDGLMRDMQGSVTADTGSYKQVNAANGVSVQYFYEVTVYLDKSVGNAYANQSLTADFRWELLK